MRKAKKVLSVFLSLSLMLSMLACVTFGVSAATQTAVCTVAVSEQNVGTDDYYIAADVTFESDVAFIAGIFEVEAQDLKLTGCTATSCTGGDAPEIHPDYDANKILFAGFSESAAQDYRSYTALTLRLKFTAETRPTSAVVVDIKNISIVNRGFEG